jgi:hypothetical protein
MEELASSETAATCDHAPLPAAAVKCSTFHAAVLESSATHTSVALAHAIVHGESAADLKSTVAVAAAAGSPPPEEEDSANTPWNAASPELSVPKSWPP